MRKPKPIEENGSDNAPTFGKTNLPTGESVLDPSINEIRVQGDKDFVDRETERLKHDGYVPSGMRKMDEDNVYRAYFIKKAELDIAGPPPPKRTPEQIAKDAADGQALLKRQGVLEKELEQLETDFHASTDPEKKEDIWKQREDVANKLRRVKARIDQVREAAEYDVQLDYGWKRHEEFQKSLGRIQRREEGCQQCGCAVSLVPGLPCPAFRGGRGWLEIEERYDSWISVLCSNPKCRVRQHVFYLAEEPTPMHPKEPSLTDGYMPTSRGGPQYFYEEE